LTMTFKEPQATEEIRRKREKVDPRKGIDAGEEGIPPEKGNPFGSVKTDRADEPP